MARRTDRVVGEASGPRAERAVRWRSLVEEWQESGLSQAEFCRRRNLAPVSLSWWKRRLARLATPVKRREGRVARDEVPSFVACRLVERGASAQTWPVSELTTTSLGVVIEFYVERLRRHQFGRKSEQIDPRQMALLFAEAVAQVMAEEEEEAAKAGDEETSSRSGRKNAHIGSIPVHNRRRTCGPLIVYLSLQIGDV